MTLPIKSSGEPWTPPEDEQLYQELLEVAAKHPGRSLAAVLTRVEHNRLAWCLRQKELATSC